MRWAHVAVLLVDRHFDGDGGALLEDPDGSQFANDAVGVGATALTRRGGDMRDPGGQAVVDDDAGGGGRAVVGDRNEIGQGLAGRDGVRARGLGDEQVATGIEHDAVVLDLAVACLGAGEIGVGRG